MIRKMFPGQPAEKCGHLKIGDIILSVNKKPLDGLSQQEAVRLLRQESSTVRLLVRRRHAELIPKEVFMDNPKQSVDPSQILANIQRKLGMLSMFVFNTCPLCPSVWFYYVYLLSPFRSPSYFTLDTSIHKMSK